VTFAGKQVLQLLYSHTFITTLRFYYALQAGAPPLYRFAAHGVGVSGLAASPHHRGFLATCSDDKTVRLWDATAAGTAKSSSKSSSSVAMPVMIANKSMAVGRLFGVQFYPGTPFLLATGGSKGQVMLTLSCASQVQLYIPWRKQLPYAGVDVITYIQTYVM
jgi:WD40 repeat protein